MTAPFLERSAPQRDMRGHNARNMNLTVEVRLFNSLARLTESTNASRKIEVSSGSTVGDLIQHLKLPIQKIFLVLRNGHDITPGPYRGGKINQDVALQDGDVIAFSGPVPYSYGYGAPVV